MNAPSPLRTTPLHVFHVQHGARLVDFAGWQMPVYYRGILEEHRAVRSAAGLFDVSHMGEVDVVGPDAAAFLNHLVTNDVAKLTPGRVLYTPMCHPNGGVLDDLLVYMRGPERYLLCINAGNIVADLAWMQAQSAGYALSLVNRSDDYALLALQGPRASEILGQMTATPLAAIRYYHFAEGRVAGIDCLISRTGYTGEDGFELYHPAADAPALAAALLQAGAAHGLLPAGLGARDSLRLEAGFPLHGHEISPQISPLTAGLGWTVKLDKGVDFLGREALRAEKLVGSPQRVVYFRTGGRSIVRAGAPVRGHDGAPVGTVLSGTLSPVLNEAIGSALVSVGATTLTVGQYGRTVPLQLVKPPFVPLPQKK